MPATLDSFHVLPPAYASCNRSEDERTVASQLPEKQAGHGYLIPPTGAACITCVSLILFMIVPSPDLHVAQLK